MNKTLLILRREYLTSGEKEILHYFNPVGAFFNGGYVCPYYLPFGE